MRGAMTDVSGEGGIYNVLSLLLRRKFARRIYEYTEAS